LFEIDLNVIFDIDGLRLFLQTLSSHGILSVIEVCIQADDEQTRLSTIEIFSNVVDYNPSLVRDYMIQQGPARSDDVSLNCQLSILC